MIQEHDLLLSIVLASLVLACIATTAFPVLYAFTRWYETRLGRALMLQAVAFALALDMTLLFALWEPTNVVIYLWVNVFVFALIAGASSYLTWKMLKHNVINPLRLRNKENTYERSTTGS